MKKIFVATFFSIFRTVARCKLVQARKHTHQTSPIIKQTSKIKVKQQHKHFMSYAIDNVVSVQMQCMLCVCVFFLMIIINKAWIIIGNTWHSEPVVVAVRVMPFFFFFFSHCLVFILFSCYVSTRSIRTIRRYKVKMDTYFWLEDDDPLAFCIK